MAHNSMARLTASKPKWGFIKVHGKGIISNRTILNRRFHVVQAQTTKLVATANVSDQKIARRSANYHPPIW
ncbi:myrcene synthase, chloroplastic-like protein, partial [Corchorus olitorius]